LFGSARLLGRLAIAGFILGAVLFSPAGVAIFLATTAVLLTPWLVILAIERRGGEHRLR
jgi:hypothetical protein